MNELRFDGRVAVITGAGRGLGRAYALLLAARGARVVVNDLGVGFKDDKADTGPAEEVVQEIRAAGGEAVANTDSVATPEGGAAIIGSALDAFGRIDVLIHNAGNVRKAPIRDLSYEDMESVLSVHLRGGFNVVRPAFPRMLEQKYGRIVLTSSINGLYGNPNVVNYSMAKAGLIGLSNVAAIEGFNDNVKSNCIIPAAVTRMSEGIDTSKFPPMDPDLVAPAVGWLAHESCSITGEMLVSVAGRVARAYAAETHGVYRPSWTIEDIAANIDAIRDMSEPWHFAPAPRGHLDHLAKSFEMASK